MIHGPRGNARPPTGTHAQARGEEILIHETEGNEGPRVGAHEHATGEARVHECGTGKGTLTRNRKRRGPTSVPAAYELLIHGTGGNGDPRGPALGNH